MKTLILCILTLFIPIMALSGVYNVNTQQEADKYPRALKLVDRTIVNPTEQDYYNAGWRPLVHEDIPKYHVSIGYNYVTKTNEIGIIYILKDYDTVPVTVDKPEIVQLAEDQYLSSWQSIFPSNASGYTNAVKLNTYVEAYKKINNNPNLAARSHSLERSFEIIEEWWIAVRNDNITGSLEGTNTTSSFHPYPWGVDSNIVVESVIAP